MELGWVSDVFIQYSDIIFAVWILAVTFLIGKTIFFIFQHYIMDVHKEEKKGSLNEHVVSEVRVPFYLIVNSIGLYYAIKSLSFLGQYGNTIGGAIIIFGVLLGAYISKKGIGAIIVWYANQDKRPLRIEKTALMSLKNVVSIFVYTIAIIIILGQLGVEITPLLASLGIGGLAIALALQPTLSSYFAGIYLASDKTVRLGDYIELDPERRGYIEKMTWRSVWIKTLTNNMIIIPNSKLADSIIINYSQPRQPMLIKIDVGVAYDSDLEYVERVALKVARRILKKTGSGVDGEEPFVRYREFADSNIKFIVLFKIKRWERQYELKDEYIKALHKEFKKEKIVISFPCRNTYTYVGK